MVMEFLAAETSNPILSAIASLPSLVSFLFTVVVHWKLFEKADEPGWKVLIPIYNIYVFYKIAWGQDRAMIPMIPIFGMIVMVILGPILMGMMIFGLFLLSILIIALFIGELVLWVITLIKLADCFAKGVPFVLGLLFLYPIFSAILAFGDMDYYEPW